MMNVTLFEREALPHLPALRHFAESLTHDRQRTDDLVQDTMLKAFRYFDSYRTGTNCRAWLFQICKHSFINEYRRKQYEPLLVDFQGEGCTTGSEEGDEHTLRVDLKDESAATSAAALIGDEVAGALDSLPADYQTVLLLNDVEGYTYDEIAVFMRVPVGTIRSRIHRARKLMSRRLEVYARGLGYHSSRMQRAA
jgi:RNA polymerase sigma-70 factor (ECF subfamily)